MEVWETITPGLRNALARGRTYATCVECGFALPKYPGRYPKCCPHCETPMHAARQDTPPTPPPVNPRTVGAD